jgi:hypothetical protein
MAMKKKEEEAHPSYKDMIKQAINTVCSFLTFYFLKSPFDRS